MSRFEFRLPDVGEGLIEAEIVAWHVAPGDRVVADQPLVSVETDKAVVEIPAPRSGQVLSCVGEVGDRIEVGDLLAELETEKADPGEATPRRRAIDEVPAKRRSDESIQCVGASAFEQHESEDDEGPTDQEDGQLRSGEDEGRVAHAGSLRSHVADKVAARASATSAVHTKIA